MSKQKFDTIFTTPPEVEAHGCHVSLRAETDKPADIAYHGFAFARTWPDGNTESFFSKDQGLDFQFSMAHAILNDPNVKLGRHDGCVMKDGDFVNVTDHIIMCKNPDSVIFKPTVMATISNAINVDTDLDVEVLFVFEDGWFFPYVKHVKTGGSYAICFTNIVEDIIGEIEDDPFTVLEEDCPNVTRNPDGTYHIIVCSETAEMYSLDFEDEPMSRDELLRAIASFRIVGLNRTVKAV